LAQKNCTYAIVGGGLAAASAIQGIRELSKNDSVVLLGREKNNPYDRPPLSKDLWSGKKRVDDIFIQDEKTYSDQNVDLKKGVEIVVLDSHKKILHDNQGNIYHFEKLLLATGGVPRILDIPGGTLEGICYYRYLEDYRKMRLKATSAKSAVVIGRGFIGSVFYSDLFEFGFEAVGEVDARLDTVMDWQKENDTGIIYYTKDGKLRGAMMCNVWNKVEWARELIRKREHITPQNLPRVA
jgi:NAD(P)H-nitrite reductase large subunit